MSDRTRLLFIFFRNVILLLKLIISHGFTHTDTDATESRPLREKQNFPESKWNLSDRARGQGEADLHVTSPTETDGEREW